MLHSDETLRIPSKVRAMPSCARQRSTKNHRRPSQKNHLFRIPREGEGKSRISRGLAVTQSRTIVAISMGVRIRNAEAANGIVVPVTGWLDARRAERTREKERFDLATFIHHQKIIMNERKASTTSRKERGLKGVKSDLQKRGKEERPLLGTRLDIREEDYCLRVENRCARKIVAGPKCWGGAEPL